MEIDWSTLIWQGRWSALEMFWSAIIVDVGTYWWFGPLLLVLILAAGWKAVARFAIYVAKVFLHTH